MNKKQMYNRIMESVVKQVKKVLLEDSYKLDPNTMSTTHNVKTPKETVKNVVKQEQSINPKKEMKKIMEKDRLSKEDIEKCIEWYEQYGVQYNPHLDGDYFKNFIHDIIKIYGNGDVNLNFINTSEVTIMKDMFAYSNFNGDISKWDVSNVKNMEYMFESSKFDGDISNWDVSNVTDMSYMFAFSRFNRDISKWNVSHITNMCRIFYNSMFDRNICWWDVSNVTDMNHMFDKCKIREEYKPQLPEYNKP